MPGKGARGFVVGECTIMGCSKEWVEAVIVGASAERVVIVGLWVDAASCSWPGRA